MTEHALYGVDFILLGAVLVVCGWIAGYEPEQAFGSASKPQPARLWTRLIFLAVGIAIMIGSALQLTGVVR